MTRKRNSKYNIPILKCKDNSQFFKHPENFQKLKHVNSKAKQTHLKIHNFIDRRIQMDTIRMNDFTKQFFGSKNASNSTVLIFM